MNMAHNIKLGRVVAEIVSPINNGFHCRAYGQDVIARFTAPGIATVVGRNYKSGRMQSVRVKV